MHPEADALLDVIFDHPDDDTPRLVYADWLQESGQESYAQFIRLQCAAAREPLWSAAANRLWEEIGRVWRRLDEEWRPATRDDWGARFKTRLDAIHFHRGFLRESLALTYTQLVRYSRSCWPWLPLPAMTIRPDYDGESEVRGLPRLHRIRRLRLQDWHDGSVIWGFLDSSHLSNLEVLDLSAGVVASGEVEGLLAPGLYPCLREVRLRVLDDDPDRAGLAGCVAPDVDPSARYLRHLRDRLEARFETVVWLAVP